MPSLQLHMLRVAAVAKLISDTFTAPLNAREVILTCLFHDMGNIIKSNLTVFPDFSEPEGVEYWKQQKEDFTLRYGPDAHKANILIAQELRLPESATRHMDAMGFSRMASVVESDSWELKITEYSDMRVGPRGILTLEERLEDGRKRYRNDGKRDGIAAEESVYEALVRSAQKLEAQIFAQSALTPEDITDASIAPLIEELRKYPVS